MKRHEPLVGALAQQPACKMKKSFFTQGGQR